MFLINQHPPNQQPSMFLADEEAGGAYGSHWLAEHRPDLFAGPDRPVVLFLGRDGGSRMLEKVIASQPQGRARMLERSRLSVAQLARLTHTSRAHVRRLLEAGEAQGHLQVEGRDVSFSADLSEDVERHYALVFELARVAAATAMAG